MSKQTLQEINVSDIQPDSANARKNITVASVQELAASIKAAKRIINPLTLRKNGKGYVLVAGHRRLQAAKLLKMKTVPAIVTDLSEEQAFAISMIENVQREDITALEESDAYNDYLKKFPTTKQEDMAAAVGKSESYIAYRLKLSNLIQPIRTMLAKDEIAIANAFEVAKLSHEDQADLFKNQKYTLTNTKKNLIDNIMRLYAHNISAAPFNPEDLTLNPEMGACSKCPFNSINQKGLFPNGNKTGLCTKSACWNKKTDADFDNKLAEAVANSETIFCVTGYENESKDLQKHLKEQGYSFVNHHLWGNIDGGKNKPGYKPVFVLDGEFRGQIAWLQISTKEDRRMGTAGLKSTSPKVVAEKKEMNFKRFIEIQMEKSQKEIRDLMLKQNYTDLTHAISPEEQAALFVYLMQEASNFAFDPKKLKALKIDNDHEGKEIVKLAMNVTLQDLAPAIREIIWEKFSDINPEDEHFILLRQISKLFFSKEVEEIEKRYAEIIKKRETNKDKAIAALTSKKKK